MCQCTRLRCEASMFPAITLICLLLHTAVMQDCKTSGEQCEDDPDCCGGCCRGATCIDTYGQCSLVEEPCLSHECPPGFECYMYRPSDCPGCGRIPDCRRMKDN